MEGVEGYTGDNIGAVEHHDGNATPLGGDMVEDCRGGVIEDDVIMRMHLRASMVARQRVSVGELKQAAILRWPSWTRRARRWGAWWRG